MLGVQRNDRLGSIGPDKNLLLEVGRRGEHRQCVVKRDDLAAYGGGDLACPGLSVQLELASFCLG